jgi:hypothetical protein
MVDLVRRKESSNLSLPDPPQRGLGKPWVRMQHSKEGVGHDGRALEGPKDGAAEKVVGTEQSEDTLQAPQPASAPSLAIARSTGAAPMPEAVREKRGAGAATALCHAGAAAVHHAGRAP